MRGYEITDRGKIIVAVVLVIVILTTAVLLAVRTWNGSNGTPVSPPIAADPDPDDDNINNGPLPNGSGSNPPDDTGNEGGEQGASNPPDGTDDDPPDDTIDDPVDDPVELPPEVGPVSINRAEGTMSFMFAPSAQSALDSNSKTMLSEFMLSPKNTSSSQIVVEMPHLSESEVTTLIRAITGAFSEHGVAQRDITFLVYQPTSDTDSGAFEIRLSFRQASTSSGRK